MTPPGISNEALGVWFRFREMMGLVRAQFKGARWWVVRARPAARPACGPPEPPASVACECVRAEGQGEPGQGGTRARSGLDCPALPCPALAALAPGCLFGSSGSGLEPQRPNQTVELISQIGGPPAQIRPFPSSTNRQ